MPTRMSWKSNVRRYVFTAQMAMTSLNSLLEFFSSLKLIAMVRYGSPKHDTVAFSLGCIGIIINYEIYKDPITNPTQHFITLQFCSFFSWHIWAQLHKFDHYRWTLPRIHKVVYANKNSQYKNQKTYGIKWFTANLIVLFSWEFTGTPPMPTSPRNQALIRPY